MSDAIELPIELNTDQAVNELKQFQNQVTKSLGAVEQSISGLKSFGVGIGAAISAIGAGFASLKIGDLLQDGIKAAGETEAALNKLANQMKLSGTFTEEALQSFEDFAGSLEKTTNVSDDVILQQAAIVKAFGLSDDQTRKLIQAATELSAVQDQDLGTSVDQLVKSYNGQSKALAASVRDVRNLTKEQLAQGAAIDLINDKLGGSAANSLNSFAGAIKSVERAFEDNEKAIGKTIIKNQELTKLIGIFRDSLDSSAEFLEKNKGAINSFISIAIDGFFGLAKAVSFVGSVIERILGGAIVAVTVPLEGLIGTLKEISEIGGTATQGLTEGLEDSLVYLKSFNNEAVKGIAKNTGAFGKFSDVLDETQKKFQSIGVESKKTSATINKSVEGTKPFIDQTELNKSKEAYKKFSLEIEKAAANETDRINIKRREQLEELEKIGREAKISTQELADQRVKINAAADKEITAIEKKENEQRQKDLKDRIENYKKLIAANPLQIILDPPKEAVYQPQGPVRPGVNELIPIKDPAYQKALESSGFSIAAAFLQALQKGGQEGARDFGSEIAGAIGGFFGGPESAAFFKELFKFSTQTQEEIKNEIKDLFDQFPELFARTVEFAPAFIDGFLEAIGDPKFYEALSKAIGRALAANTDYLARQWGIKSGDEFVQKISAASDQLGRNISNSFLGDIGAYLSDLFKNFLNGFSTIWTGIAQSVLGQAVAQLGQNIANFFSQFGQAVGNFFTNFASSIGGLFTGISELLKSFRDGLISGVENAGIAIKDAVGNLATSLGDGIKNVVQNVINGVGDFFGQFKEAFSGIIDQIRDPIQSISDAVDRLVNAVKGIGGSASSAGGKISGGFKKVFGFAEGGVVPPGFPNDSYPAFLTSGERVVPEGRSLPDDSKSMDLNNALLAQLVTLLKQPQTVSAVAELNGRALADIVLQLNRSNARLA